MAICRKKNESLKKFSGNLAEFEMWRNRIVDHVSRDNPKWRSILETFEKWETPITRDWLMRQEDTAGHSAWDLAERLEGFLVEYLSDSLYRRRRQLAGGELGNGFEMWRWLHQEYQGGSEAIRLGGARRLQDWPRCNKLESLSQHLDDWVECLQTYCSDMLHAPGTLRSMILGIIPADFEDEIIAKPHIRTWQEIVSYCKVKTVYRRQKQLAEQARRPGGRINAMMGEDDEDDDKSDDKSKEAATTGPPQWFQEFVNKLATQPKKKRGEGANTSDSKTKGIRIKFEGCWHCGKSGHSRRKCEEFLKLMAAANKGITDPKQWKLPQGYMGKYEEAKKKAKAKAKAGKLNALDDYSGEEEEWSDSDEDLVGPAASGNRICAMVNLNGPKFFPLEADDDDDDDLVCGECSEDDPEANDDAVEDLVDHLQTWAHKTIVKFQNPKKENQGKKVVVNSLTQLDKLLLGKSKVAKLAAAATQKKDSGKANNILPDVDLEDDEVLALVDSGSTINAASIKRHFPQYKKNIVKSRAQLRGDTATTAGGHELKHEGRCRVDVVMGDKEFQIPFSNMKVDIPILSVRRMVRCGNSVVFNEDGGEIINQASGHKIHFFEAMGAYWVKMKVNPPTDNDGDVPMTPVFSRPGR